MFMENTTSDHLIAFLLSARSTKIYRKILWSRMIVRQRGLKPSIFRQHIYRLHKKGILETRGDEIHIYRESLLKFLVKKNSVMKNISPKKTEKVLLSFDIPETKKKTRDWIRNQLKYWDFKMIHKSLWLGDGPLPNEFKDGLKQLKIHENIKIFRVKKLP